MIKILAIDDNRDNLTALKAVLSDRLPDATLQTAPDGQQGLAIARSDDPDVILLDIVMPGMDGYAVCRRLKGDECLRAIPVLFLTAIRTDRDGRIKALEAGAEGFLTKPFDDVELVAQVQAMAKIKAANRRQRLEKDQLAALVAERTRELEQELTERKRVDEALRESEAMFRLLAESTQDWVYWHGLDGRFLYVSPAAEKITGYSPREFIADPGLLDRLVLAEDRAANAAKTAAALATDAPLFLEFRIRHRDGRLVWIDHTCHVLLGADGKSLGRRATNRDATERKKVEEALREQMAELQHWYEVTLGREGRVLELKKEVNELLAGAGKPLRYPND